MKKPSRRMRKVETQKAMRRRMEEIRKETSPPEPEPTPALNVVSIVHVPVPKPVVVEIATVEEIIPRRPLAEMLDANRALDWRIRRLLSDRLLSTEDVEVMRFSVSLAGYVRSRKRIAPDAIDALRIVGHQPLWDERGNVTQLGYDVWEAFRRRMRTEGAISNIMFGRIIKNATQAA